MYLINMLSLFLSTIRTSMAKFSKVKYAVHNPRSSLLNIKNAQSVTWSVKSVTVDFGMSKDLHNISNALIVAELI